jgi:hypothetical protein
MTNIVALIMSAALVGSVVWFSIENRRHEAALDERLAALRSYNKAFTARADEMTRYLSDFVMLKADIGETVREDD